MLLESCTSSPKNSPTAYLSVTQSTNTQSCLALLSLLLYCCLKSARLHILCLCLSSQSCLDVTQEKQMCLWGWKVERHFFCGGKWKIEQMCNRLGDDIDQSTIYMIKWSIRYMHKMWIFNFKSRKKSAVPEWITAPCFIKLRVKASDMSSYKWNLRDRWMNAAVKLWSFHQNSLYCGQKWCMAASKRS